MQSIKYGTAFFRKGRPSHHYKRTDFDLDEADVLLKKITEMAQYLKSKNEEKI